MAASSTRVHHVSMVHINCCSNESWKCVSLLEDERTSTKGCVSHAMHNAGIVANSILNLKVLVEYKLRFGGCNIWGFHTWAQALLGKKQEYIGLWE